MSIAWRRIAQDEDVRGLAALIVGCSIALCSGCRFDDDASPISDGPDQMGGAESGAAGEFGSAGTTSSGATSGGGGTNASGGGATGGSPGSGSNASGATGSPGGSGGSSGGTTSSGGSTGSGGSGSGGGATGGSGTGAAGSGGTGATGSGGTGATGSGGTGAAGSGGTGAAGSGGTGADYVVTTSADENDAGATASNPLGSGLSLREAITLANNTAGAEVIYVGVPAVLLTSSLTSATDDVSLYGGGTTVTMSPPGGGICIRFQPGTHLVEGFILRDCSYGIYNDRATVIVRNNQIFDTTQDGYYSGGSDSQVVGNLLVRTQGVSAPPNGG